MISLEALAALFRQREALDAQISKRFKSNPMPLDAVCVGCGSLDVKETAINKPISEA
jgi:hypothetical protein